MKYFFCSITISIGLIFTQPSIAQTTYPVTSQSATYPLTTQLAPIQIAEFVKIFKFGSFDADRAIALRAKLQPLANNNDPVACYWLAKTYDLYEFGVGRDRDRNTALKWYNRSAQLNYFPAVYLLYKAYFYNFMRIATDYSESMKWLNKALHISSGKEKIEVLLDFARLSNPDRNDYHIAVSKYIPRSKNALLSYLQQAFVIDPHNGRVADWYGEILDKSKRYVEALKVYSYSDNAYTWKRLGKMYEQGQGTAPNIDWLDLNILAIDQ